jgi:MFS family permease
MQSGMHLIPMGAGIILTTPFAGAFMDKYGPSKIVHIAFPLMAAGLGVFAIGVARQADYAPTLLVGLMLIGMGVGCAATPLSAACVQSLAPHQIARGTTLRSVNNQVGGAIGAALMTVLLTNQFHRHEDVLPVDPSAMSTRTPAAGLANTASHHLVHAYTTVFVAAAALAVGATIAAAFLPLSSAGKCDATQTI